MPTPFFRFHYHSSFACSGDQFARSGLFSSREVFEAHLARWNTLGWTYQQTQDDIVKNSVPERVLCIESHSIGYRAQGAYNGPFVHHHLFVVEAVDAAHAAEFACCSPEEAAESNAWDLLLRVGGRAA
jgi:hypothetical protein